MSDDNRNASPYDEEGYPLGSKRDDPQTELILHLSGEKKRLEQEAFLHKTDYTKDMAAVLVNTNVRLPENYTVIRRENPESGQRFSFILEFRYGDQRFAFQQWVSVIACRSVEKFEKEQPIALFLLAVTAKRYMDKHHNYSR